MKNDEIFTMSSQQYQPVSDEDMGDLEVGGAIEEAKNMAALRLVVETTLAEEVGLFRLRRGHTIDGD
jgi:hypothetical protein